MPSTVLLVVDGLGLSGKTRSLVSVACRLDRRRFAPVVCSFSAEPSPLALELETAGVPVHTIGCRDGIDPGAILRLARLAWSIGADVVHCSNPRPMLYGGIAARAIGIRATVASLSAFACQVPDQAYGFLPQPLATASRRNVYRNRLAVASMRYVVAVSLRLGVRFCRHNHLPGEKLRVIPYGADVEAAARVTPERRAEIRQRLGLQPGDVVIGSAGRLVEQKDYPTQLQAFALAASRAPRLRMVIAGDGPLKADLERLARELGIAGRVQFLGARDDVSALLGSVDLFALASKFEPFGVALLEARAAGLPIVATRVNEIPHIVTHGESGLLAPPGDARRMADLFVTLAEDDSQRVRLGTRGLAEAQRHSLQTAVTAYEDLYEEALEHRSHMLTAPLGRA